MSELTEKIDRLELIEKLYSDALDKTSKVFQPGGILHNYGRLGDNIFDCVEKLALEYLQLKKEVEGLRQKNTPICPSLVYRVFCKVGDNLSSIFGGAYNIVYTPKQFNYPKIGKLFGFKSLEYANQFRYHCLSLNNEIYPIWVCEAEGIENMDVIAPNHLEIEAFWQAKTGRYMNRRSPVDGTVFCDAIKPLAQIVV